MPGYWLEDVSQLVDLADGGDVDEVGLANLPCVIEILFFLFPQGEHEVREQYVPEDELTTPTTYHCAAPPSTYLTHTK